MIFCVEDDSNIRELVVYTLETTGFRARGFEDREGILGDPGPGDAKACAPGYHASRGRRDRDLEEAEILVQGPSGRSR